MSIAPSLAIPDVAPTRLGDNAMHPLAWIPPQSLSLLDVGCNDGALLIDCRKHYPKMMLSGVDVNPAAIDKAKLSLPDAHLQCIEDVALPFASGSFDCVTCIEVIEHVPTRDRPRLIAEIRRVLKPGGVFILRCPHAGAFAWLDSNNLRFRVPALYGLLVKRGLRDHGYAHGAADVCWHHHFTIQEMEDMIGAGFAQQHLRFGGLLLFPVVDILRWPFYRLRQYDHPLLKMLDRLASWDLGINYGTLSFDVLSVLVKVGG